jgi:hypothetical protein
MFFAGVVDNGEQIIVGDKLPVADILFFLRPIIQMY